MLIVSGNLASAASAIRYNLEMFVRRVVVTRALFPKFVCVSVRQQGKQDATAVKLVRVGTGCFKLPHA